MDVLNTSEKEYFKHIGFVFQHHGLFPHLSACHNVTIVLEKVHNKSKDEALAIAKVLFEQFELTDHLHKKPAQLSGGQAQRVSIVRSLAASPSLLFFDEPTSALDPELVGEVLDVIKTLAQSGLTMLIVTHEMSFAKDVADKVVFMDQGVVVEAAHPSILFNNPTQERTKAFLSRIVHG
jgi:ABC-type polar amino acid transport system ATPase subunit